MKGEGSLEEIKLSQNITLIALGFTQEDYVGLEVIDEVFKIVTISSPTLYVPGHYG